jgi:hypothetical protein
MLPVTHERDRLNCGREFAAGSIPPVPGGTSQRRRTETVWRQADRYKVPRIVFVNKMDKIGADFFNCVRMIKDRTGATPAPIALPIGAEDKLEGIIDLIKMEEWTWKGEDLGASWTRQPIPDDLKEKAAEYRQVLLDTVPVLCGTAFKNKGVQPLLDAVIDYLPSPDRRPGIKVAPEEGQDETQERRHIPADPDAPLRRPRLQDHQRQVRQPDLRARLSRHAAPGRHGPEHHQGFARARSAGCSRCTPTSARRSRKSPPATSPPSWG